jgi:glycosyltransferase involved in cell wall biosynthesis
MMGQLIPRGWEAAARVGRKRPLRRAALRLAARGDYCRTLAFDLAPVTFTVIMPTYNRADQLEEAARAVLAQDFRDFELLIVDDCSSDGTPEVCCRLEAEDSRVRSLRLRANTGSCGAARNAALSSARGSILAFCDDDVIWHPSHLRQCSSALVDGDACSTQARRFLPDGRFLDIIGGAWGDAGPKIGQLDANTLAVRRHVMQPFRDTRGRYFTDDAELAWRLHHSGVRFAFVDEPTVDYTFNPQSHAFIYEVKEMDDGPRVVARPRVRSVRAARSRVAEIAGVRLGRISGRPHPADRQVAAPHH